MYENGKIYMGLAGDKRVELALNMCNRHGLIAGARKDSILEKCGVPILRLRTDGSDEERKIVGKLHELL